MKIEVNDNKVVIEFDGSKEPVVFGNNSFDKDQEIERLKERKDNFYKNNSGLRGRLVDEKAELLNLSKEAADLKMQIKHLNKSIDSLSEECDEKDERIKELSLIHKGLNKLLEPDYEEDE